MTLCLAAGVVVLVKQAGLPLGFGRLPVVEVPAGAAGTAGTALEQPGDLDGDHLDDSLEDRLAQQFAPVVFHGELETTFPTNVDKWLAGASLSFAGEGVSPARIANGPLEQVELLNRSASTQGGRVSSSGSRSRDKRVSFIVDDVAVERRSGTVMVPEDWVTYVHSYPNVDGGVSVQYWRAYLRNDTWFLGLDLSHGGDWEAITVHLDSRQRPARVTYLEHSGIVDVTRSVQWDGDHPLVWSEESSHSSHADTSRSRSARWFRHQTWTGGTVVRWDSTLVGPSGGLRNVGEKSRPRDGQLFVQYSGLWGSMGRLFITSGYWGPAFNETDATCEDGSPAYRPYFPRPAARAGCGRLYMRAWCDGIDPARLAPEVECRAAADVR